MYNNKKTDDTRRYSLSLVILFVWLITNILFPGELSTIKATLSGLLILFGIANIIHTGLVPDFKIIEGLIFFEVFAYLSILYGRSGGYVDGGIVSVFIIRPVLIVLIISNLNIRLDGKKFMQLLDTSAIILSLYNFIYVIGALGIIPQLFVWELDNGNVTSTSASFIAARLTNQGALSFFIPYMAVRLEISKKPISIMSISFTLGMIASLLSGRRIVQIIAVMILIYLIFRIRRISVSNIAKMFFRVVLSVLGIFSIGSIMSSVLHLQNIFLTIYSTVSDAFNEDATSSIIRHSQANYLIDGWIHHFFFGQGLNSYVPEYIRNYDTPWSYEYVYYAFLYQIGLIGTLLLLCLVIALILPMLKNILENQSKSILVGFSFFLIAAATNPMFTNIWIWVIVLAGYQFSKYNLNSKGIDYI